MSRRWAFIAFACLVFIADRISKISVLNAFAEGESLAVLPRVLHLTRVNNTGGAFGILRGSTLFLAAVSVAFLAGMAIFLWREPEKKGASLWAWALVAGGALGNLYDRVRYGYVVDFIDLRVWPVFNLADAGICIGIAWILWRMALERGKA